MKLKWPFAPPQVPTAVAFAVMAFALVVAYLLCLLMPTVRHPHAPLFLAVIVATWVGGALPGLVSLFSCTMMMNYFFAQPQQTPALALIDMAASATFSCVGGIITIAVASLRQCYWRCARLLRDERAASSEAAIAHQTLQDLQDLTSALLAAHYPQSVIDIALDSGLPLVQARAGALFVLNRSSHSLKLLDSRSLRGEDLGPWQRFALDQGNPLTESLCRNEPHYIDRATLSSLGSTTLAGLVSPLDHAAAILPLTAGGQGLGVIWLTFGRALVRNDRETRTMQVLAQQVSHALERSQLLQAREDFLLIAGHELRTPVTALQLQLQSTERIVSGGDALRTYDKLVSRVRKQTRLVERISLLIDALLDVGRLSQGSLQLTPEDVDLSAMVREVTDRLADTAAAAGCQLEVRIDGEVCGRWDRARIDQVLTNLLTNAFRCSQGQPVEVVVYRNQDRAALEVRDRGLGIDPRDQERIFERFERLEPTKKSAGLGVGLWLARHIVEASGGTIAVKSSPGRGATFTVSLPTGGAHLA